jgi:hypothetical protein
MYQSLKYCSIDLFIIPIIDLTSFIVTFITIIIIKVFYLRLLLYFSFHAQSTIGHQAIKSGRNYIKI